MAQAPVHLTPSQDFENQIKVAKNLIRMGEQFGCKPMAAKGCRMMIKALAQKLVNQLTPEESALLAQTKAEYKQHIKELEMQHGRTLDSV